MYVCRSDVTGVRFFSSRFFVYYESVKRKRELNIRLT
jgi:hypothetical protein